MGQVYFQNIPPLVKASSTTCTLAATHLGQPTRIQIGGQAYKLSSTLTLNTATTGLGGLDTGTLGSTQLWYVYVCANTSGVVGLVASLTGPSTGPSGFSGRYQLIGAFYTNDINQVGATVTINGVAETDWINLQTTYIELRGSSNGAIFNNYSVTDVRFKRKGDEIYYEGKVLFSGVPGNGVGELSFLMPFSAYTGTKFYVDTTKLTLANGNNRGVAVAKDFGSTSYVGSMLWNSNSFGGSAQFYILGPAATNWSPTVPFSFNTSDYITFWVSAPIQGWTTSLLG